MNKLRFICPLAWREWKYDGLILVTVFHILFFSAKIIAMLFILNHHAYLQLIIMINAGKSTTASMLAYVLKSMGDDLTAVVGAQVPQVSSYLLHFGRKIWIFSDCKMHFLVTTFSVQTFYVSIVKDLFICRYIHSLFN